MTVVSEHVHACCMSGSHTAVTTPAAAAAVADAAADAAVHGGAGALCLQAVAMLEGPRHHDQCILPPWFQLPVPAFVAWRLSVVEETLCEYVTDDLHSPGLQTLLDAHSAT